MKFIYEFCGKCVEIDSLYDRVHTMCRAYQTEKPADYAVKITQADIDIERDRSAKEDIKEGKTVRKFPDDYLETLAVYRKIAEKMVEYDTVLFHGSCIAVDGEGYLFTAKSGTGKSTHTALWRKKFGKRALMVNDDKPLLQITENGVWAYGTPWDGKHHLSTKISVPLKAICILERSAENHIEKITKSAAYWMIMQQVYRPDNVQGMIATLKLIDKLAEKVSLYRLGCNMEEEAAEVAYNGMKGITT